MLLQLNQLFYWNHHASFWIVFSKKNIPPDRSLMLPSNWSRGQVSECIFHVYLSFSFPPFSVSDSTQGRRLSDRSRCQPRLWLHCQSHMRREGGERGRQTHKYLQICELFSLWLTTPPAHTDVMMKVSRDWVFLAYWDSSHMQLTTIHFIRLFSPFFP